MLVLAYYQEGQLGRSRNSGTRRPAHLVAQQPPPQLGDHIPRPNFRLFLVPGVHHSGGGPGFTEFDSMTALENWVEKGQAPDKLIAGRLSNGVVERTRPVFPYPIMARYSGKGDPRQADSFVPFDPSDH